MYSFIQLKRLDLSRRRRGSEKLTVVRVAGLCSTKIGLVSEQSSKCLRLSNLSAWLVQLAVQANGASMERCDCIAHLRLHPSYAETNRSMRLASCASRYLKLCAASLFLAIFVCLLFPRLDLPPAVLHLGTTASRRCDRVPCSLGDRLGLQFSWPGQRI